MSEYYERSSAPPEPPDKGPLTPPDQPYEPVSPEDARILAIAAAQHFADYYTSPPADKIPHLRNAAGAARAAAAGDATWAPLWDALTTLLEGADERDPAKIRRMADVVDMCTPLLEHPPWAPRP